MSTRSTDVSTIAQCPGRWVLQNFYESEQAEASFFELGSALHAGIEAAVIDGLDEDQAKALVSARLEAWITGLDGRPVLETSTRGVDTILDDARTMLGNWFMFVHPDSAKRIPIYDEYEWPPRVEVPFDAHVGTKYPVWGQIDAIFEKKNSTSIAMVDWKSSKSAQRSSDQLHFYQLGYGYMDGDVAWFHNVARVQARAAVQMADPYPGDDAVRQRVLATEAIKEQTVEGKYPKFEPSALCNWCPVQQVCPADGDYRNREENADALRRMLRLAKPLVEIEKEVA